MRSVSVILILYYNSRSIKVVIFLNRRPKALHRLGQNACLSLKFHGCSFPRSILARMSPTSHEEIGRVGRVGRRRYEDVHNKSCVSDVPARTLRGCYEDTAVVEFRLDWRRRKPTVYLRLAVDHVSSSGELLTLASMSSTSRSTSAVSGDG